MGGSNRVVLDIEEDYHFLSSLGLTSKDQFSRFLNVQTKTESAGHFCLNLHSNGMAYISLGPNHPLLKESLNIASLELAKGRLSNKVEGKKKRGAQTLNKESHLCTIKTSCGKSYLVRGLLGGARLIELNKSLEDKPKEALHSFFAILQTKWGEVENVPISEWIPEDYE